MLQQIVVVLIVAAAVLFSAWKLLPARRRLQALLVLDRFAARRSTLKRWRDRVLAPRIAKASGGGCGGCAANTPPRPR
jgi:hypothetical protein